MICYCSELRDDYIRRSGRRRSPERASGFPIRRQDKGNRTSGRKALPVVGRRERRTQEEYQSRAFKARTPRVLEQ